MSTAIGAPILEQPGSFVFDRQSGLVNERRWFGIHNAVLGQAFFESNFADSIRFESHGAAASLLARYGFPLDGGAELLITQFEMRGEEISQSIWQHPDFSALPRSIQKEVITASQSGNDDQTDLGAIVLACDEFYGIATPEADAAYLVARAAYDLLGVGTDSYLVDQSYVFIRTRTGSRNYQAFIEFQGDGRIWSSGQVAAYVQDPAPFNVPQLSAVPNSETLKLAFGWRKRPTDVVRISNGNQQIVESWQCARWSMLLYKPATFGP